MTSQAPIIILGGRSLVAPYLINRLSEKALGAEVISRRSLTNLPPGFTCRSIDINTEAEWNAPQGAIIISLLPIWVLAENLSHFMEAKSIIAISSTSLFSKADSSDPKERSISKDIERAETRLDNWGKRNPVAYTILRPTMIYDGKNDQNVARIAKILRHFFIFPLAYPAKGLRQPIHADDVAKAVLGAMNNTKCTNKSFNIAGGEVVSYKEMVKRILSAMHRPRLVIMMPEFALRMAFKCLTYLKIINEGKFGFNVFRRMNEDLVFHCENSGKILKYAPRKFEPNVD